MVWLKKGGGGGGDKKTAAHRGAASGSSMSPEDTLRSLKVEVTCSAQDTIISVQLEGLEDAQLEQAIKAVDKLIEKKVSVFVSESKKTKERWADPVFGPQAGDDGGLKSLCKNQVNFLPLPPSPPTLPSPSSSFSSPSVLLSSSASFLFLLLFLFLLAHSPVLAHSSSGDIYDQNRRATRSRLSSTSRRTR